jgi:hypothetical protein
VSLLVAVLWLLVGSAHAHSWMIREGYGTCAECHLDPSGSGLLTDYGRAQGEILLRTHYDERAPDWEPGNAKDFLWGVVPLPEWLELGGSSRSAYLVQDSGETSTNRFIQMQADLRAHLQIESFRAYGSLALAEEGATEALITSMPDMNLVSREHWLGYDVNDRMLVRAGRMPLPFGLRVEEHTLLARQATQVDINDEQQGGVAWGYNGRAFRTEVMGILGNFQLSPDDYRERGGTGFFEWLPSSRGAFGVSALAAHANVDPEYLVERLRQAYGVTARYSPIEEIAVYGEADLLLEDRNDDSFTGNTGFVAVDWQIVQGLHLKGTGEWLSYDNDDLADQIGGWGTVQWFFLPHADLRFDIIQRSATTPSTDLKVDTTTGLGQLHFYL